ncbi:hypothetical protein RDI58_018799 [Solanum bulbocastanum]|uniref:Uncharacterized protein n=1 Tax=Solanum bulbocastanum TaxID=147425 RepID=A0AAN8TEW4_SOLBU
MDLSMYFVAMKGKMVYGRFSLVDHLKREELENGYQVTSKGNTILHVAALFGQRGFVGEVLKITPALLCYKNKKNETALHIAANAGKSEVVSELLSVEGKETILVRMTDDIGDTALHKAMRGGHIDIVRMLEQTYVSGPSNRTPLHAAVIQEHTECARSLWEWNKTLCKELDKWGWNSLHYAVKQGLKEIVSDMLGWKKSLAYLPAGSENDWTTAFHNAASEGDALMICELLNHCPDCWDMLNCNGQNAFHVALLNGHEMFVYAFLGSGICDSLVDEADNEGNTPLHLLASSGNRVP